MVKIVLSPAFQVISHSYWPPRNPIYFECAKLLAGVTIILQCNLVVGYSLGCFGREWNARFLRRSGPVELLLSAHGNTDLIVSRQAEYHRLPDVTGRSYGQLDDLFERRIPAKKFKKTVYTGQCGAQHIKKGEVVAV